MERFADTLYNAIYGDGLLPAIVINVLLVLSLIVILSAVGSGVQAIREKIRDRRDERRRRREREDRERQVAEEKARERNGFLARLARLRNMGEWVKCECFYDERHGSVRNPAYVAEQDLLRRCLIEKTTRRYVIPHGQFPIVYDVGLVRLTEAGKAEARRLSPDGFCRPICSPLSDDDRYLLSSYGDGEQFEDNISERLYCLEDSGFISIIDLRTDYHFTPNRFFLTDKGRAAL